MKHPLPAIELDGERRHALGDDADVVADALDLNIGVAAVVFGAFCDPLNVATQAVNVATQVVNLATQVVNLATQVVNLATQAMNVATQVVNLVAQAVDPAAQAFDCF